MAEIVSFQAHQSAADAARMEFAAGVLDGLLREARVKPDRIPPRLARAILRARDALETQAAVIEADILEISP